MYYLLRGDIETLQNTVTDGRYEYVPPMIILYFLGFVTRAYRWRALLNYRTTLHHSFNIMSAGYLLSLLPLRVGELARAWMTTRLDPPIQFFTAFSSIVVERVLDVMAVLVMLGIALVLLPVPSEVAVTGGTLGLAILLVGAVMLYFAHSRSVAHQVLAWVLNRLPFLRRFDLKNWLDHALDGLEPLTSRPTLAAVVGWTVASWVVSVVAGYVLLLVFFETPNFGAILLTLVLLALAVAIPSVPGNLGTFEAAGVAGLYFAGLVASTEAPENAPAIAYSVLLHIINVGAYVAIGLYGLTAEQTSLEQVRAGLNAAPSVE